MSMVAIEGLACAWIQIAEEVVFPAENNGPVLTKECFLGKHFAFL